MIKKAEEQAEALEQQGLTADAAAIRKQINDALGRIAQTPGASSEDPLCPEITHFCP